MVNMARVILEIKINHYLNFGLEAVSIIVNQSYMVDIIGDRVVLVLNTCATINRPLMKNIRDGEKNNIPFQIHIQNSLIFTLYGGRIPINQNYMSVGNHWRYFVIFEVIVFQFTHQKESL